MEAAVHFTPRGLLVPVRQWGVNGFGQELLFPHLNQSTTDLLSLSLLLFLVCLFSFSWTFTLLNKHPLSPMKPLFFACEELNAGCETSKKTPPEVDFDSSFWSPPPCRLSHSVNTISQQHLEGISSKLEQTSAQIFVVTGQMWPHGVLCAHTKIKSGCFKCFGGKKDIVEKDIEIP